MIDARSEPDNRFATWQQRISEFCQTVPSHVRIIAVTKQMPSEAIRAAYAAGIRDIGENRVQEAREKQAALGDLTDLRWHLIGQLQSNKAQQARQIFDWIQTIDSLKLAQRLNHLAASSSSIAPDPTKPPRGVLQLCLQVKLRPDANKTGWDPETLLAALPELNQLTSVQIRGLMIIPPFGLSSAATRSIFDEAQALAQKIHQQGWPNIQTDQLSMGMSDDWPLAVAAGATMIRPGRTLFGDRPATPAPPVTSLKHSQSR
jgi:PLP dependent protein